MKNLITLLFISLLSINMSIGQETEDNREVINLINENRSLGLISYLTAIKTISESKIISEVEKELPDAEKIEQSKQYNLLKLRIDAFINQLVGDMITKNSVRKYKKINSYIEKQDKKLLDQYKNYRSFLLLIDKQITDFISTPVAAPEFAIAAITVTEFLGLARFGFDIVKDIREAKTKKVEAISEELTQLKLRSISELKEKAKKETKKAKK